MIDTGLDSEDYREWNKSKQEKRAKNRDDSAKILQDFGIKFEDKNMGAHLIITGNGKTIDFWPGTGLWKMRGSKQKYRGVHSLVAFIYGASK